LRILHVVPSIDPEQGGTVEAVRILTEGLQKLGHQADVVCMDSPDSPSAAEWPSTKIVALGKGRFGAYGFHGRFIPWLVANGKDYDCVVLHGLWQFTGVAVQRASAVSGVPYVVFPHGMLDVWFRSQSRAKHLKKQIYWLLAENQVVDSARGVLFTTEEERRDARGSFRPYRPTEFVVGLGASDAPEDIQLQGALFRTRFPETVGKRCILFMGRLNPKKGCDLLLQAFASVCGHDAELHLIMAGPDDAGWKSRLELLASDLGISGRVTWTGMLDRSQRWGAFDSSEVFVLPSHQENFGMAVVESLAAGKPVLISNRVNIHPEITSAKAGFVAPDDTDGTQLLLESWLRLGPADLEQTGVRARGCYVDRFSSVSVAARLVCLIQEIASVHE
jgi:glycosyltransferase involved in cell wall biosynthesis